MLFWVSVFDSSDWSVTGASLIHRWRPFWKTRGWIICRCRWRRRRTSSTCLASAPGFRKFWQWRSRWRPWNTWKTGRVLCNDPLWDQKELYRLSLFFIEMYRICMYVCGYNKSEYIGFIFASAKNVFLLLCSEQLLWVYCICDSLQKY